jgi:hypothetical protein
MRPQNRGPPARHQAEKRFPLVQKKTVRTMRLRLRLLVPSPGRTHCNTAHSPAGTLVGENEIILGQVDDYRRLSRLKRSGTVQAVGGGLH